MEDMNAFPVLTRLWYEFQGFTHKCMRVAVHPHLTSYEDKIEKWIKK